MFEICTMTSAFEGKRNGEVIGYPEMICRSKAAGFDVLDLNMCTLDRQCGNPLAADCWNQRVDEIIGEIERQKVTFFQTHPPFRKGNIETFPDSEKEDFYWKMVFRSLDITARIGARWAVIHAINDAADPENIDLQLTKNHRHYDKIVDYADKLGIGIAFENMVQAPNAVHRFGSLPEEMIALADSYNSDNVGICWDFGHGNIAVAHRHADALRSLGARLKCVHINDNMGVLDDHVVPFCGNIPWAELMPVLKEINFSGVLDLELSFTNKLPDDLKDEAVRFTRTVAGKLKELIR